VASAKFILEGRAARRRLVLLICPSACSENPPKTRDQKPSNGAVRVLRIACPNCGSRFHDRPIPCANETV
jgi:hypothetical protein